LYSEGLDSDRCDATLFWFAMLIVLLEFVLLATLVIWFVVDVLIVWRKKTMRDQG
jgi:hypothetical protein